MLRDQSLERIRNAIQMKKIELRGADMFVHKFKIETPRMHSINYFENQLITKQHNKQILEMIIAAELGP